MVYKWVWGDGKLELSAGFSKNIHHFMLLEKIADELGHVPENYEGGNYSEDTFHGGQFDICTITWQPTGTCPTADQIKVLIQMELHRYQDKSAMILAHVLEMRLAADVEDTEPEFNFGFLEDPHPMLYPPAFEDGDDITQEAAEKIKAHALDALRSGGYEGADAWIVFTVYGSGISYNWDESGDFDVQMWIDIDKYNTAYPSEPSTADDVVSAVRQIIQTVNFPSFKDLGLTADGSDEVDGATGSMLIQYYPKPGMGTEEENLSSKPYACYNLDTGEWYQRPQPMTPEFYGEHFLMVMQKAEDIAVQSESLLEELQRNTVTWQFFTQLAKELGTNEYDDAIAEAKVNAEEQKEGVANLFKGVFGGRAEAYSPEGEGIYDERDIVQKLLEVWGVFQRLKHFARQPLPWDEQLLPVSPEKESKLSLVRTSDWSEIMQNAQELRNNGYVQITSNGAQHVEGQVNSQEDPTQVYQTEFDRADPNSSAITTWNCTCPWGEVSWGRTRQWKKYEGRPCKHTLALYWTSLATPLDEQQPEAQGQQQLFNPQQTLTPAGTSPAPVPGGPNMAPAGPQPIPATNPGVAPPAAPAPPPKPSVITKPGEGGTAAIPGALSKLRESAFRFESVFTNGQSVRNKVPLIGSDRDGATRQVPTGSTGEVLYSDAKDTIAIFPLDSGILEPHLVRVQGLTTEFEKSQMRDPFVKRRSYVYS